MTTLPLSKTCARRSPPRYYPLRFVLLVFLGIFGLYLASLLYFSKETSEALRAPVSAFPIAKLPSQVRLLYRQELGSGGTVVDFVDRQEMISLKVLKLHGSFENTPSPETLLQAFRTGETSINGESIPSFLLEYGRANLDAPRARFEKPLRIPFLGGEIPAIELETNKGRHYSFGTILRGNTLYFFLALRSAHYPSAARLAELLQLALPDKGLSPEEEAHPEG